MCLNYLDVEGRGVTCPNPECGLENGKEASFCKYCGTALVEEEVAIPGIVETALTISNALTGGISDEFEEQEEMSEEDAAAFEEFKREQAEMRGETLEDEGEELAPPSALDLEQEAEQELTPPPPAEEELAFEEEPPAPMPAEEELAFDEEPPAPVPAEEELAFDEEPVAAGVEPAVGVEAAISESDRAVAAPLPEGELSEEDLIPPIPDDLPGFDDEVTTPSVAGTAAVADEIEAPAEEITEAAESELSLGDEEVAAEENAEAASGDDEEESEDDDLGDWALDFDDEK
jgi:hypothetical protein